MITIHNNEEPLYKLGRELAARYGGVTYSSAELVVANNKGWYIGWDYAHCMDYSVYMPCKSLAKKWTTREMASECKRVIDQIEGLIKEPPKEETNERI